MIRINPDENNGDYAYCEECHLKYRRDWAIAWHLLQHGENPQLFLGGKQNG